MASIVKAMLIPAKGASESPGVVYRRHALAAPYPDPHQGGDISPTTCGRAGDILGFHVGNQVSPRLSHGALEAARRRWRRCQAHESVARTRRLLGRAQPALAVGAPAPSRVSAAHP